MSGEAFERLHNENVEGLLAFLTVQTGDRWLAEDIVGARHADAKRVAGRGRREDLALSGRVARCAPAVADVASEIAARLS
jgi:hypothetical protein